MSAAFFLTLDDAANHLKREGFTCVSLNRREWRNPEGTCARITKMPDGTFEITYFCI